MAEPRAEADQQMCIGSANCVEIAQGVFQLNGEEKAEVVDPNARDMETLRKESPTSDAWITGVRGAHKVEPGRV